MALIKRLQDWLYDRPATVLGIDFSAAALKLVSMRIDQTPGCVDKLAAVDWPPALAEGAWLAQPEEAALFLKQCLSMHGINARQAVVSVSSRVAFVREIDFPMMSEDELASAMQWDIEQYIPLTPGSYYYDYLPAGSGKSELEMKVLLFAAPKEWVDTVARIIEQAGLKLTAVETEAMALKRLVPGLTDYLLLDMGNATSQLTVFQRGLPVAQRNIPIGSAYFTQALADYLGEPSEEAERIKRYRPDEAAGLCQQAEEGRSAFQALGREVNRTVEYYRINNSAAAFSAVVITGGGWLPAGGEGLAAFLNTSIQTLAPFQHVGLSRTQWDAEFLTRLEPRLAVAVGLCLREVQCHEAND